jgi:coniferyl-aldehyde dehydrogenase
MRAAADHLTPVTLELGGKSPALVSRTADLAVAARRIVHGKTTNSGQVCVAPDYAVVPREDVKMFCEHVRLAYDALAGNGASGTGMIDERGFQRMLDLLADAKALGADVTACGRIRPQSRQLPLFLVTRVTPQMRIAREEIFGPILPVMTYEAFDEALDGIRHGDRPLALYYFGCDEAEQRRVLHDVHAGGVTFNDWGWHVLNHDLPFGGTGRSGMGTYHGEEGFRELSHAKAVFSEHRWFPAGLFHPPYGNWVQQCVLRWYFGKSSRPAA